MGLTRKRDEENEDYLDGIEVITRGEGPDDDPEVEVIDIAAGLTAEDISGTTARRAAEGALETEPDPELVAAEDADEPDDEPEPEPADLDPDDPDDDPDDPADLDPDDPAFYDDPAPAEPGLLASRNGKLYLAISIVAVVVAVIVGYMIGSGSGAGTASSSTGYGVSSAYVTDDELDNIVAVWSFDGETYELTAQEAIESQYSLETVQYDDGTYAAPTADIILTYVQNQVLYLTAQSEGISLTDEEVAEYSEETLGSSDYEEIAETYGLTEEQAEEIVVQMAHIQALYESVIPEITVSYPSAPDEPEDGDYSSASEEYAAYIIELAGDEWDADAGTWASTDGDYYAALGEEDFTADSATYSQALTAYYVAYTLYYEAYTEASSVWSVYANELYGAADVTIYGLYS